MLLVPVVTPLSKYARGGVNRNGGGRSVTSAVPLRIAICDHKVSKLDLIRPIGTVQEDGIRNLLWLHRVPRPMMVQEFKTFGRAWHACQRSVGIINFSMARF